HRVRRPGQGHRGPPPRAGGSHAPYGAARLQRLGSRAARGRDRHGGMAAGAPRRRGALRRRYPGPVGARLYAERPQPGRDDLDAYRWRGMGGSNMDKREEGEDSELDEDSEPLTIRQEPPDLGLGPGTPVPPAPQANRWPATMLILGSPPPDVDAAPATVRKAP